MEYYESTCTDPRWNLALEEYVFDCMDPRQNYFLLWQNRNTIVVGRNQNTVGEINNEFVRQHGITVVRRLSGGGAVYHDLGNLNFTFISNASNVQQLNFQVFCTPILETLRSFGVHAELSGRNDITIDGKKISGNSQYLKNGRVLHHGTLLFDSDLSVISKALQVDQEKIKSKGINSVQSRITNLKDYLPVGITMNIFKDQLLQYLNTADPLHPFELSDDAISEIAMRKSLRYDTWEWNYGSSPEYQSTQKRRIEGCGTIEVSVTVSEGLISDLRIRGDFFGCGDLSTLAKALTNCPCHREAVAELLTSLNLEWYISGITPYQLSEIIVP